MNDRMCETCKQPSMEKYCGWSCDPASKPYALAQITTQIEKLMNAAPGGADTKYGYLTALRDIQLYILSLQGFND